MRHWNVHSIRSTICVGMCGNKIATIMPATSFTPSRKSCYQRQQRMDDDGSPGRVASIDQWTTSKVRKVASEDISEARRRFVRLACME